MLRKRRNVTDFSECAGTWTLIGHEMGLGEVPAPDWRCDGTAAGVIPKPGFEVPVTRYTDDRDARWTAVRSFNRPGFVSHESACVVS